MQNHKNCCNNSGKEQGKMDTEFDKDDTKENDAIITAENCNRHRTNKEETNPEEGLPNENRKNAETRTTLQATSSPTSCKETFVRGTSDNSRTESTNNPEAAMLGEQTQAVIHEDIKVKNAFAVQVGDNNVVRSGPSHEREDPAMVGATASLQHVQSVNFSPGQVLVYRNVQIENCKYVQVGDNNSVVIEKVTPQEDAYVKACCELDIDPKTADDIREKLSNRDVLEQFAKKMETYQVTCKIQAATRGCILLELEVPTEEDRLQLLRMARDGTFQQVLLETFLPEFAAEGRAVSMNLAIGVRSPSQDMVEELQGATASSDQEDVVVVDIPAPTHDSPPVTSDQDQPDSAEGQTSKQSDDPGDMAEDHKNFSGEELSDAASTKAAFDTDVTQKLPSEDDDREGEITVSVEGYAEAVPLGTGAAATNFPQGEFDENFLTCDICKNRYEDPRVVPCGHTFCAKCLETWRKGKGEFTCPACRQVVPLKEGGISSLPSNFHIKKLIDFRTQQSREEAYPQCQMCESGAKVAGSCKDCHFFLCKNCLTGHGKIPELKDHTTTQLDIPTENCPQHTDQPLTFYCLPCTKLVCRDCTTTEHLKGPNHDPQEVSKVTEQFKEELQTLVGETQNKLKETDYILRRELISIRTNCELEKQKIQEHFAQLRANLDQEEQQMTSRLREMEGEQQKSLLEKRKDFEETLSPNEERLQFCKDILTRGSDVEILTLKEQLKYNLNHLKTKKISYGGLSQEITFADNRDIKTFRCSPGFLKHSDTNIKVTELPVASLPTTIIFDDTSSMSSQGDYPWSSLGYRSREATPRVTVFPETLNKYCQQKMRLPIDVSKDRCAILDSTKISEELFEAVWRPQTSGKHVVGITTWDERRGIGWESFIRPSPLTQVTVNVGSNNPVLRFGQRGRQQGLFERPRDVAVWGDRLYVADAGNSRVQVFDLSGNFCFSIPTTASLASLAVQTDGTILVNCDEEVIQKFSPSGELMNKFSLGEHCISPYGLAVQRDGRVVVAEPGKHSIFLFEADGTLVRQVGGLGKGDGQLNRPCFVCVDKEDNIIVADTGNSRAQVFDKDLHFQHKFGVKGTQPQDMCYPMGVSVDSRGNIVLVNLGETIDETVQGVNIQVFRPDGTWVSSISSDGDKLNQPHGMAVTEDGHVFVTDIKNHCIRKYRYM